MKIIIIGGRGNGTVIASTIEDCKNFGQDIECIGFLNDNEIEINGYPILGGIQNNDWTKLPNDYYFIFAMTNVKQAAERYKMLENLQIPNNRFAKVVHPTAVVSSKASLGFGVAIMPFVVVSPNCVVGNHSQMYAQSFIGHDSILGEMVFVANNASIGGRVRVNKGAHIGSNSSIIERVEIGEFSVIGIASNVLKSIDANEIVVGNPAKVIIK